MNKKFQSIQKCLDKDIEKAWENFKMHIFFGFTFSLFLFIFITGPIAYHFPNSELFFIILYPTLTILVLRSLIVYFIRAYEYRIIIANIEGIKEFNSDEEVVYDEKTIEDILEKIQKIYHMLTLLKKYHHKKRKLSFYNKRIISKHLLLEQVQYYFSIITSIQTNLAQQILTQKKSLESASSSLSTHIHGTDELNQVSELQRARLDKQIEQFEELQRVLVNV